MKITKLLFPGQYEDAYLYSGCLLLLGEDRTLRVYNLRRLMAVLETNYPELAPVLTLMFSRNDWLGAYHLKAFLRNDYIRAAVARAFEKLSLPFAVADSDDMLINIQDLKINDTSVLDMLIYNRRLYLGATGGLYHFELNWRSATVEIVDEPRKRIDARCVNTLAGYGTVNASCGKEGLFASIDEFGWLQSKRNGFPEMRPLASRSLSTSWMNYDLVNYTSYDNPYILRNSHIKLNYSAGLDAERTVLTEFGAQALDIGELFQRLQDQYNFDKNAIQYTYNTDNVLIAHTVDGQFYSLKFRFKDEGLPEYRFTRTQNRIGARILSASQANPGVVIETDDQVLLLADGGWIPLHEAPVIAVRTFPRSERYNHIAAITTEEGVLLVGMCDDKELEER
ncbi:MAG: hypothetical protein IPP13_23100 [Kouleothrix sp.]|jgi:hypothetical protein|nr:hypothetical protein [Kouleothrix sp.]